jgi:hypothetical protein
MTADAVSFILSSGLTCFGRLVANARSCTSSDAACSALSETGLLASPSPAYVTAAGDGGAAIALDSASIFTAFSNCSGKPRAASSAFALAVADANTDASRNGLLLMLPDRLKKLQRGRRCRPSLGAPDAIVYLIEERRPLVDSAPRASLLVAARRLRVKDRRFTSRPSTCVVSASRRPSGRLIDACTDQGFSMRFSQGSKCPIGIFSD